MTAENGSPLHVRRTDEKDEEGHYIWVEVPPPTQDEIYAHQRRIDIALGRTVPKPTEETIDYLTSLT